MSKKENATWAKQTLNSYYGLREPGQEAREVVLIAPILGGLMNTCRLEEIAPIIKELLSEDPLITKITEIYERGGSLWSALQQKNNNTEIINNG